MNNKKEFITKTIPFEAFVSKGVDSSGSNGVEICGYASVFNLVDLHGDLMEKGAFSRGRGKKRSPFMLWQHQVNHFCGKWEACEEDEYGLKVKGIVSTSTEWGRKALENIRKGKVSGLSVGFFCDESTKVKNVRVIKSATLVEISLVTTPANPYSRFSPLNGDFLDIESFGSCASI